MSGSAFFAHAAVGQQGPGSGSLATASSIHTHHAWADGSGEEQGSQGQGAAAAAWAGGQQALAATAPVPPAFPATRTHLWDRTPAGATIVIDLRNLRVEVRLSPAMWPLLQRLQEQQGGGTSGGSGTNAVLVAQLAAGSSTTRGLAVELTTSGAAAAAADATVAIPLAFGPPLPDAAMVQLGSTLEVAASRTRALAGLASLLAARLAYQPDGRGGLALHGVAATPAPILDFKPLLSKRVATGPLAQRLQDLLLHSPPPEDGFLTMDRARSLVLLPASEAASYSVPLVGCWVAGPLDVKHPLVAAACMRFLFSKALADKATAADASFLLLLFSCGRASMPLCYEVHISLQGGFLPLQAHRFSIAWRAEHPTEAAACQAAACPSVMLPGCPVALNQRAVQWASSSSSSVRGPGEAVPALPPPALHSLAPQLPAQAAGLAFPCGPPLFFTPPAPMLPGPASYGQPSPPSAVAGPAAQQMQSKDAESWRSSSWGKQGSPRQPWQKAKGAALEATEQQQGDGMCDHAAASLDGTAWAIAAVEAVTREGTTPAHSPPLPQPGLSAPKAHVGSSVHSTVSSPPVKAGSTSCRGFNQASPKSPSGGAALMASSAEPPPVRSLPSLAAWGSSSFLSSTPPVPAQPSADSVQDGMQAAAPGSTATPRGSQFSSQEPAEGIALPPQVDERLQPQPPLQHLAPPPVLPHAPAVHPGSVAALHNSADFSQLLPPTAQQPASLPTAGGLGWLAQQGATSSEVAQLQQEVVLLRQEVELLRSQVQALQLAPAMAAPTAVPLVQHFQLQHGQWGAPAAALAFPGLEPAHAPQQQAQQAGQQADQQVQQQQADQQLRQLQQQQAEQAEQQRDQSPIPQQVPSLQLPLPEADPGDTGEATPAGVLHAEQPDLHKLACSARDGSCLGMQPPAALLPCSLHPATVGGLPSSSQQETWHEAEAAIDLLIAEAERAASVACCRTEEGEGTASEQQQLALQSAEEEGEQQQEQQEAGRQAPEGQLQAPALEGEAPASAAQTPCATLTGTTLQTADVPARSLGRRCSHGYSSDAAYDDRRADEGEEDDEDEELERKYGLRPGRPSRGPISGASGSWRRGAAAWHDYDYE